MRMNRTCCFIIGLSLMVGATQAATTTYHRSGTGASIDGTDYNTWEEPYTIQALLGAMKYSNLKFKLGDEKKEVDLSLMPQLGGVWGTAPRGETLQYGLECSFLLGFTTDDVSLHYSPPGGVPGGTYIRISTTMWMFDFAGGGYLSMYLNKSKSLRIYAAGGPLMMFANYRSNQKDDQATIPEYEDEDESAFGVGVYARAGFEFRVYDAGMLGMGVRGTWNSVDFSEIQGGPSNLSGLAAFVSFTAGF